MKPKAFHRSLILASSMLLVVTSAQAVTYTWTKLVTTAGATDNWSTGTNWSAVPASAASTTLVFGYSWTSNSTAATNTLTNDVANPFLLNVLTLGISTPTAANGSNVALVNIAGSPLDFVSNGGTTPQVNLSQNRSAGQVVSFNVQSNVVLTNNTLFTGNGTANFTISGGISGTGTFTKAGTSKLTLSGTNSYAAKTTISGGILQFTNAVSLYNNTQASWTAANISVANGATLALNVGGAGQFTAANVNTLLSNLSGANGTSTTGFAAGSILALDTTGAATTVTGNIVDSTGTGGGAVGVTKQGTNLLTLSGANTYTGTTSIIGGNLTLAPSAGGMNLGAVTANTSSTGANANITLTLGGSGTNTIGSITETSNAATQLIFVKNTTATWSVGNVDLKQGNTGTTTGVTAGILELDGTLTIGVSPTSTTLRQFFINGGTLAYNNAGAMKTQGNTTTAVGNGTWLTFNGGTINNTSGAAISTSTHNPNMMLNANMTFVGSDSLNFGTGRVSLGSTAGTSRTVTVSNNSLTLGGIVSNGTTATGLTKAGAGTLTLGGANLYTGATNVNNGTLLVNGSISTSILTTVASGATIGGSGTVGALTVQAGGFIAPGNSPGIMNSGNFVQAGTYSAEINGLTPGTQHDQINVTGSVDITGGSLTTLFTGSYAVNDMIFLLLNDGADAITGTYAGFAQGAVVSNYGGLDWQISYLADSGTNSFLGGNDIALMAVPEPSIALLGGLGAILLLRRRR